MIGWAACHTVTLVEELHVPSRWTRNAGCRVGHIAQSTCRSTSRLDSTHAITALTSHWRDPAIIANACAFRTNAMRTTRRHFATRIRHLHLNIDIQRTGDNTWNAHAILRDAKYRCQIAHQILRIKEVLGSDFKAQREYHKGYLPNLNPRACTAAYNHINLLLPCSESV